MKVKLILYFLFFTFVVSARNSDEGEMFFNNKQYQKARVIYESLVKKKPSDAFYHFRLARCCYELKDYEEAITHFEMSGTKFPQRDMYLGELYFNTYRFDQSVMAYQTYLSTLKNSPDTIVFQQKIKKSEMATRLFARVDDIAIVDSVCVNKTEFLKFYKFSSELGTLTQEHLKLSGRKSQDKIKYTTQRQDRVYFSDSTRGNMDLFTSYKLLDEWSAPESVSSLINTKANENYPFLLLDGVTLYFASDGENSLGGYDIFVTRLDPSSNTYLSPENVGFPFNSTANDYMMAIDEQHHLGWFATDRNQPSGKVMIYTFIPNEPKIIVRSDNFDDIRRAAMLKTYRRVSLDSVRNKVVEQDVKPDVGSRMRFIVNDSVVYTRVEQFGSDELRKEFEEYHKLQDEVLRLKGELDRKRTEFATAEKEEQKQLLTNSILEMEARLPQVEKKMKEKELYIRNEENKRLKGDL